MPLSLNRVVDVYKLIGESLDPGSSVLIRVTLLNFADVVHQKEVVEGVSAAKSKNTATYLSIIRRVSNSYH